MDVFRMHGLAHGPADFAGAATAGGRWNPIGTPMLYTAEHLSLACLEALVHLDKRQLPRDYVWSRAELPARPGILTVEDLASIVSCQAAGRNWIESRNELAIRVPSVVIPEEFNVALNPAHPAYHDLLWSDPKPFRFDPRLFTVEPQIL
jgi:RES domain-containing protein